MALQITIVGAHNVDMLENIADEVFDNPISPDNLRVYVADPAQILFIAIESACVIGQLKAVVHRHPDKQPNLYVEELGVGSAYRRRGVGTALMNAAVTMSHNLGCAEVWLATEPDNVAANGFYRSFGMHSQHVVMYNQVL